MAPVEPPVEGTIDDVVDWVRGAATGVQPVDGWPDRAQHALEVEQAKGDEKRDALVERLQAIITAGTEAEQNSAPDETPEAPDVLNAAAPAGGPEQDVWYRAPSGAEFHVTLRSAAHERLVADGAVRIDGPTPTA